MRTETIFLMTYVDNGSDWHRHQQHNFDQNMFQQLENCIDVHWFWRIEMTWRYPKYSLFKACCVCKIVTTKRETDIGINNKNIKLNVCVYSMVLFISFFFAIYCWEEFSATFPFSAFQCVRYRRTWYTLIHTRICASIGKNKKCGWRTWIWRLNLMGGRRVLNTPAVRMNFWICVYSLKCLVMSMLVYVAAEIWENETENREWEQSPGIRNNRIILIILFFYYGQHFAIRNLQLYRDAFLF